MSLSFNSNVFHSIFKNVNLINRCGRATDFVKIHGNALIYSKSYFERSKKFDTNIHLSEVTQLQMVSHIIMF